MLGKEIGKTIGDNRHGSKKNNRQDKGLILTEGAGKERQKATIRGRREHGVWR